MAPWRGDTDSDTAHDRAVRTLRILIRPWTTAYAPSTWRRFGYAVVALPLHVVCVAVTLVGGAGTADRWQRRTARTVVGADVEPAGRRPAGPRVVVRSLLSLPILAAAWLLLDYAISNVPGNVLYPVRPTVSIALDYHDVAVPWNPWWGVPHRFAPHPGGIWASTYTAWGGPTLAGAWAVHAGLTLLVLFPVLAWAVRGLVRLTVCLVWR